ncbi:MAG: hypothetical protein RLZZ540_353 [Bacteroidota bacterium]|jgi:peptidoglycan/LPS O-acetylase OafA/YrhL
MSKIYFKGLDGLRGIAALAVVLGHVELIKQAFQFENMYGGGGPFFLYLGSLAVTFFFVLSGFLITFLLLKEKDSKGTIGIKNFYLRRMFRIWPVYYMLFVLGFFVLPKLLLPGVLLPKTIDAESYWNSFFFNLILLPNFSKISNPIAFQSWSIGVEEQFYIFWPLLVSRIKSLKRLLIAMLAIVFGIYMLRSGMYLATIFELQLPFLNTINSFFGESRFDNMAIGGILAILFYKNPDFRFSVIQKVLVGVCTVLILYKQTAIGFGLDNILAALVFTGLIFWVVNKREFIILDHSVFLFLGKISYGIYMYHVVGIVVALNVVLFLYPDYDGNGLQSNLMLYSLTLFTTLLISYGSYHFMEKRILKYKEKITFV